MLFCSDLHKPRSSQAHVATAHTIVLVLHCLSDAHPTDPTHTPNTTQGTGASGAAEAPSTVTSFTQVQFTEASGESQISCIH